MRTVLLAVSGTSPAIITETVWGLAVESPPVVADEVVVVTTSRGELDIARLLTAPENGWKGKSVWETLRKDVFKKCDLPASSTALQISIRVIDLPGAEGVREKATDIRSAEENAQAADFILNALSPYALSEDCRVIASIAGGRKTMGALLYGAMTLVAKETDRITHVLVSEPFEMCREFFYPAQPGSGLEGYDAMTKQKFPIRARDAVVDLADIPFVPLRNGFREHGEGSMGFGGLVRRYSKELRREAAGKPVIHVNLRNSILTVDGVEIRLTGREILAGYFLFTRLQEGRKPFPAIADAIDPFGKFFAELKTELEAGGMKTHRAIVGFGGTVMSTTLTQGLSSLREKLTKKGLAHTIPYLAPARSRVGFEAEIQKGEGK